MKKLNIIKNFILIAQFLLIAGVCLGGGFILSRNADVFMPIGEPSLKITSKEVQDQVLPLIPKPSGDPIVLTVSTVDFSMQATIGLRLFIVAMAVLAVGYFVLILEIFKRIVKDVRENVPFTVQNISRVKTIGLLVTLSPVLEFLLRRAFMFWINSKFVFNGMVLTSEGKFGWSFFVLGLLVIVLGVAFKQGRKMQEENELTV